MADTSTPSANDPINPDSINSPAQPAIPPGRAPQPTPKPRRGRLWLKILVGVVVVLLLLVLLIPTIASMGFVRSIVVGKINQQINGHVDISDWKVGWTGGLHVDGVRVLDEQGAQILQLPHLSTQLSLVDAIRGKYHLGRVEIDGLNCLAKWDENGNLNLTKLIKSKPAAQDAGKKPEPAPQDKKPEASDKPLPDVQADLVLKDCTITLQRPDQVVHVSAINGEFNVPDINSPIQTSLDAKCRVGEGNKDGTIKLAGRVDAIQNNRVLKPAEMDVDEKLEVQGVDLASLKPFLGKGGAIDTLAGDTNVQLAVLLKPKSDGSVEGQIRSHGFKVGGSATKGDVYQLNELAVLIPRTSIAFPADTQDFNDARIRVGSGSPGEAIALQFDEGSVKLSADLLPRALQNVAANQKPGSPGQVQISTDIGLAELAKKLPNLFKVRENVRITGGGRFTELTTIQLDPQKAAIQQTLHMDAIQAEDTQAKKPITLQPVDLTLHGTSLGGGGKLPDLRDLALNLKRGATTADVTAITIADLRARIHADLDELDRELSQLMDMGETKLAGLADVTIDSAGDLQPVNGSAKVTGAVKLTNLEVSGVNELSIHQPATNLGWNATLGRGEKSFIQKVDGSVHLAAERMQVARQPKSGEPAGPPVLNDYTLTLDTTGAYAADPAGGMRLSVSQLNLTDNQKLISVQKVGDNAIEVVSTADHKTTGGGKVQIGSDLKGLNDVLQRLKGPQVVAQDENGAELRSGRLDGTIDLAQTAPQPGQDQLQINGNFDLTDITVATGRQNAPLDHERLTIALKARAADGLANLEVDQLDAKGNLLNASVTETSVKLSNGPTDPRPVSTLQMVRRATVHIDLPSLPKLQALKDAFSPPPAPVAPTAGNAVRPEPGIALADASGTPPAGAISRPRRGASPRNDRAPAAAAEPAPAPAAPPAPKANLTSGSATIDLKVTGDGQRLLITPVVAGRDIAFKCGTVAYPVGGVDMNTEIAVVPTAESATTVPATLGSTPPPAPSLMQQIQELEVSKLLVRGIGSEITLPEKLQVKNLAGLMEMFASAPTGGRSHTSDDAEVTAALLARGDFGRIMSLLDALKGEAPQSTYTGNYALDERIKTSNGTIAATGRGDLNELVVSSPGGASFSEKAVRLLNDTTLDWHKQALTINNVSLAMETSKALSVVLKGAISDLSKQRKFDQTLTADLTYDAAKLWPFILPMMSKERQQSARDWQVAGSFQKRIEVGGSYPAGVPFDQSIKQIWAKGEIALDKYVGSGATLERFVLPFVLRDGVARIAYADKPAGQDLPPAASLNGGSLTLAGAAVNLADPHPRLHLDPNTKLLENVSINPAFAQTFLGDAINNPMFVGADQSAGQLDVTAVSCERLPIDSTVTQPVKENDGHAELVLAVSRVQVGNPMLRQLADQAQTLSVFRGAGQVNFQSLQGSIRNYHVVIDHGVTTHDMTMEIGEHKYPLHLGGNVAMATRAMSMTMDLPLSLFGLDKDKTATQMLGDSIKLPIGGTATRPQFDLAGLVQKNLLQNPGNLLERFTKPGDAKGGNGKSDPAGAAEDLLGNLFNKGKKDKDKKRNDNNPPQNEGK